MIDVADVRLRPDEYQRAADQKRVSVSISEFLALDQQYRDALTAFESLRAEQNAMSKKIGALKGQDRDQALASMKQVAEKVKELSEASRLLEEQWHGYQLRLASIPDARVPVGKDDSENVPLRVVGEVPQFGFAPRDHVALAQMHRLFDAERGVRIAGSRSYFLTGNGARLQHAVLSLAFDLLYKKGYTLMDPPHIVKYDAMMGTGYLPGDEDAAYRLDDRDPQQYLIGTSEVPVCSFHQEEILAEDELPKRYAGYSPCYRREAGSYGKDTTGMYRVHQFYKVEQVIICHADAGVSAAFHQEILGNAEELLGLLELPYRVVTVCTGDMGKGQVYKNDIECWMPSRNGYGETHSCSTFHEFQARRLGIRYKNKHGKNVFAHTLNNTLLASPRILIPLLEMHQQADGSIAIPRALRPYLCGEERWEVPA
jgi:seryl-tRNA synthetase